MQPVLNIEDIRNVEKRLAASGVSMSELMHRAGNALAQEVSQHTETKKVAILTGFGNNGGDGWVCASELYKQGFEVTVVTPLPVEDIDSDLARVVAAGAKKNGVPVVVAPPRDELESILAGCDLIVDAMLGTGFNGGLRAPFDIWIEAANNSGCYIVAADVPSGLSAQTGHVFDDGIMADLTVTMIALKPGLLADEGRDVCGKIVVAPLANQTEELVYEADPVAWRVDAVDYIDILPTETSAQNKFTRGRVLVVGGSVRYPGAAIMSAMAAARSGAGYVTLAVPAPIVPVCQMHLLNIPVIGLPADEKGYFGEGADEIVAKLAEKADAIVAGPGMGNTASTAAITTKLLQSEKPLILDADALDVLARLTMNRLDNYPELIRRTAPLVLTPHAGELGRMMGLVDQSPDSLTSSLEAARRIVWASGGSELVIVAKGTATACVAVEVALLPKPGPAGLATAGTGDVLSGIMGGLLAHNRPTTDELVLMCSYACELQGTAARNASKKFGANGFIATDLIEELGLANDALQARSQWALGQMVENEQM